MKMKLFLFVVLAVFVAGCAVLWVQLLWCRHDAEARLEREIGFHAIRQDITKYPKVSAAF